MTEKPRTYNGDLSHLPAALAPLCSQERWVVWAWEESPSKNGASNKWTKVPYRARNPSRKAKSNDPSTWGSYADAVAAVAAGKADGIGFMLSTSDIAAGDLDHCRDPETEAVAPWANKLHAEANGAYLEVTVSGRGMRIIGITASGLKTHRKFTFVRETGAGLELYRNAERFITISGLEVGTCTKLPPLDDFVDTMVARYDGKAQSANGAHGQQGYDFNKAGAQIDYDDVIRNGAPEGQRSELFQACVWHLAAKGKSVEEIVAELEQHPHGIGEKYEGRLPEEVGRSFSKWRSQKFAAATGASEGDTGSASGAGSAGSNSWPQIYVLAGELPRVVNEAEEALLDSGKEVYQRGGQVVRPVLSKLKASDDRSTWAWRIIEVTQPHMVEMLTCAAQFLRYDGRSRDFRPIDAPDKVAKAYLNRQGNWKLPILFGVTDTPFLRRDGSVCERPGYDAASGLLCKLDGVFPPIPQEPDRDEAETALAVIEQLISTFPFVTKADHAVALSAILTALDRRSMSTAPLHAFTAPLPGTGKSLLVDLASVLAIGRPIPVIAQGRQEEELEKRLGASMLHGDQLISIDNCDHILQGSFLCQVLTQQRLNVRVLGFSQHVEVPVNAAVYATGNNLTVAGDLNRRTLLCSLDAKCEHPEKRQFVGNPLEHVRENRGALVAAALTVLRAWHVSGQRSALAAPGSFEEWSQRVREPLIWLGRADPCGTMLKIKDNDPVRAALGIVLKQWERHLGPGPSYTVQEVIDRAVNIADFHLALTNVAYARRHEAVGNQQLGKWLTTIQGRIVDGLKLEKTGSTDGYSRWSLMRVS
jgi:hypothetical protein